MANKILLLFAHPAQHRSEVNIDVFRAAKELGFVTAVDLYAQYPTFQIDIDFEQQQLLDHDVIIFQFPLFWYSTPAILKEWQDLVLEHDFAYGSKGKALHGKVFFCATSAGGPRSAYQTGGMNNFPIRELLRPLEQTASLTGMVYLPPFVLYSSRTAKQEKRIAGHVAAWQQLLTLIHNGRLDIPKAQKLGYLGDDVCDFYPLTLAAATTAAAKEVSP